MYSTLRNRLNVRFWQMVDANRIEDAKRIERAFCAWWAKNCSKY